MSSRPPAPGGAVDRRRAVRIGLTGPIGCGKSTVARWLADRGAAIVDADVLARAVTALGQPAHDAILARFGDVVRGDAGDLDRAALARLVFADPAALADLEAIVHPAVRPRILAAIDAADAAGAPAVVVEAIKLVESGLDGLCDEVWLIDCAPTVQRERLAARGMAADDVERRIAAQGDIRSRLGSRPAVRVVASDGTERAVRRAVETLLDGALAERGWDVSPGDAPP